MYRRSNVRNKWHTEWVFGRISHLHKHLKGSDIHHPRVRVLFHSRIAQARGQRESLARCTAPGIQQLGKGHCLERRRTGRVPKTVQRSLLTIHVPSVRSMDPRSHRIQHTASLASSEGAFEIMAQLDTRVLGRFRGRFSSWTCLVVGCWQQGPGKLATRPCQVLTVDKHRLESHKSVRSIYGSLIRSLLHCFTKRQCISMGTHGPEFIFLYSRNQKSHNKPVSVPQVSWLRDLLHSGQGHEANTARGGAECCICLSTRPSCNKSRSLLYYGMFFFLLGMPVVGLLVTNLNYVETIIPRALWGISDQTFYMGVQSLENWWWGFFCFSFVLLLWLFLFPHMLQCRNQQWNAPTLNV